MPATLSSNDQSIPYLHAHQVIGYLVRLTIILASTLVLLPSAKAATGAWQVGKGGYIEGRLISSVNSSGDLVTIPAGLELKIKPGWKTYWRSPGDAGLPPRLNWSASKNLSKATLSYPTPLRFKLFGIQTFGYSEQVVLPIEVGVAKPGDGIVLNATVEVLVCEKICIPQTLNLTLNLPTGTASPDTEAAQLINRFHNAVPKSGPTPALEISRAIATTHADLPAIEVHVTANAAMNKPDVYAEFDPYVSFEAPVVQFSPDKRKATLILAVSEALPDGHRLGGSTATLTMTDGTHAVVQTKIVEEGAPVSYFDSITTQLKIIAFAILGGMILNMMPCVLPVLSIKLVSFAKHRDAPEKRVRLSFLATAAGIIISMLGLAVILIALKSTGQTIGWGIQFQQPIFIVAMAIVVTLFACNLWGFFEIALPARLSNWAGQASNAGQGVVGEFMAGALATLLATPCSAPFIGTAVGFALAGGTAQILTVFASLGIGLAMPYIAIAIRPSLVAIMPKPGSWMATLRVVLGFALAATAVWLLWVLAGQVNQISLAVISVLLLALVTALALRGTIARATSPAALLALVVSTVLATLGASYALQPHKPLTSTSEFANNVTWHAFDRDKIKSLVAQGKTVFVDVTADWCITCKANKSLAIDTKTISDRLNKDVIAMRADWTSPDEQITKFLASYGRFGIPFNIVYGPNKPRGVVMPELLTPDIVLRAINSATNRPTSGNRKTTSDGDPRG
ncbi:MAG: protein-disulfide reductase DsbD family protein [Hyphomicrobiaceae bacterium]